MPAKNGQRFTLASIPGRPWSVGFRYRVINAIDVATPNKATITEVAFDDSLTVPTIVSQQSVTLNQGQFYENATSTGNFTLIVVVSGSPGNRYPLEVSMQSIVIAVNSQYEAIGYRLVVCRLKLSFDRYVRLGSTKSNRIKHRR